MAMSSTSSGFTKRASSAGRVEFGASRFAAATSTWRRRFERDGISRGSGAEPTVAEQFAASRSALGRPRSTGINGHAAGRAAREADREQGPARPRCRWPAGAATRSRCAATPITRMRFAAQVCDVEQPRDGSGSRRRRPARSSTKVTGSLCSATSCTIWSKPRAGTWSSRSRRAGRSSAARPAAKVTACCSAMPTS